MNDLISRQAAIDALGEKPLAWTEGEYELGLQNQWQSDVDALNDLPSAEPEIIRCGDCKWFQCNMRPDGYLPKGVEEFECRHWCGTCDPTDFCSYGERRQHEVR